MRSSGLGAGVECPLEESAALLKLTLRAARAGSWAWDMVSGEAFWSEEYHHLVGTNPRTCKPSLEAWQRTVHPEDRERVTAELWRAVAERRETSLEYRVLRPDGAVLWVSSQGQMLYGPDGRPLRMLGVNFDVTERRLAEQALRQREEELRTITDGIPSLISYVDAQQRYRFNNLAYEEQFGISRGEITGRHIREVIGEVAYEGIRPHIDAALAGREARFEVLVDYKTAGERWVDARYIPHFGPQGQVLGFFALVNDITALKRTEIALRDSEERFRTAVENMLDCLGIYSAVRDEGGAIVDFRVEYVNAAACANNHMAREEQVGRLLCDLLPSHRGSELFQDYCRVVETGEPLIRETAYEDTYGGQRLRRVFDLRAAQLGDGFVAAWRDVTLGKEQEAALRDADRRKDEFLATLAHELRSPLASIRNAVEVQRHLDVPSPKARRMREVIERQADQLTRMVDDLLDVSRISQGKILLRPESFELAALLARAVETSRPLIDAAGHRLTVSFPEEAVTLEGDLARLVQALSNLLNNAAKYTEPGGNIWLTAEALDREVVVRVKDDGIGIPADLLPNVFDLFAQAERSRDRSQGGLGIGLALVRSIAELHGGKAEAFSAGPGQGSELVLRLPRPD